MSLASMRCASAVRPFTSSRASSVVVQAERLRLGNLSPAEGARPDKRRKGRGTAAGQVRAPMPVAGSSPPAAGHTTTRW